MAVTSMQGSLVLYTSLGHVEKSGTHHLRKETTETSNNNAQAQPHASQCH